MPCCSRGGKKVRNDPRILEEFAKFRPGLLARSIDLHYEPLLSLSSSSTAPLLSALVHREGKRLLAPFQRGRKKDSMESLSIDERTNGAPPPFFLPFQNAARRPWELKDPIWIAILPSSLSLSAFFAPLRWQIDAWFSHRCTDLPLERPSSTIRFFLFYTHRVLEFPPSSFIYWRKRKKNLALSLSFRHLGKYRRSEEWSEYFIFRKLTTMASSTSMFQFLDDIRVSKSGVLRNRD